MNPNLEYFPLIKLRLGKIRLAYTCITLESERQFFCPKYESRILSYEHVCVFLATLTVAFL